jgi:heat-inducible transcriptional repressor
LINEHIRTGKPVGSESLRKVAGLKVSPATIRSELAYLEKNGYLKHLYTSSGRVPTDKGYRYYVDYLLNTNEFSLEERRAIFNYFGKCDEEFKEVLRKSTSIISKTMLCIGLSVLRGQQDNKIKHVDLVPISFNEILVILISDKGFIGKSHIKVPVIDNDINYLEKFINEKFARLNKKQFDIKAKNIVSLLSSSKTLQQICMAITELMEEQEKKDLFYEGTSYLMDYPEIADSEHFKTVASFLGKTEDLIKEFYGWLGTKPFIVRIGDEISDNQINDFSIILSGIRLNEDTVGAVGVLGPKRLNYNKAVASVCCVADNISHCLSNN